MSEHECVFVEEEEPSGRKILVPCLTCGYPGMDALEQLRDDVAMWSRTAKDIVKEMRALAEDFNANGNSRELGDPRAAVWHEAARLIVTRLEHGA
ncbi:hypothetical protein ACSHWG_00980 [Leucobacter sp. Z1108]|uniref:hypothetical protein n=1 Tax=Leucobacter sp. Z1108 TaxID=3439066 RepID=UPI003F3820BE